MSKHTPGPWRSDVYGNIHSRNDDGSDGGYVATTSLDGTRTGFRKEGVANAALIAAAPDLLSELMALADHLDVRDAAHYHGSTDLVKRARAIIAKAEGSA